MSKLNLKYNAKKIAELEDAANKSLEQIISDFRISTLINFLRLGLDLDNDDKIDEFIKTYGKIELQIQVIEALIDAGFLPKAIDTNSIRESLSEGLSGASKTNGERAK